MGEGVSCSNIKNRNGVVRANVLMLTGDISDGAGVEGFTPPYTAVHKVPPPPLFLSTRCYIMLTGSLIGGFTGHYAGASENCGEEAEEDRH
jgi:hypothetical protein